jgi:tRNA threonylcarbamoyladenosine biosynthesis protein TsaB
MLLAIDSSTEACSVALLNGEELHQQFLLTPREHTQRLLPMVDEVLADAGISLQQLNAIAFGRGPGSFTGLRICLGAVQGLAFGADLPVVPVSSLMALAQTAFDQNKVEADQQVLAAIDARMDEVYWQQCKFEQGLAVAVSEEKLSAPEAVAVNEAAQQVFGAGSGWDYQSRMPEQNVICYDNQVLPAAAAVVKLAQRDFAAGNYCRADQALPTYLRDEVAWKKQSQ